MKRIEISIIHHDYREASRQRRGASQVNTLIQATLSERNGLAAARGTISAPDAVSGLSAVVLRTFLVRNEVIEVVRLIAAVDRFADEADGAVAKAGVDAAGMVARRGNHGEVFVAIFSACRRVRGKHRPEESIRVMRVVPTPTKMLIANRSNAVCVGDFAVGAASRRADGGGEAERASDRTTVIEVALKEDDTALNFLLVSASTDTSFAEENGVARTVGDRGKVDGLLISVAERGTRFVPFPA